MKLPNEGLHAYADSVGTASLAVAQTSQLCGIHDGDMCASPEVDATCEHMSSTARPRHHELDHDGQVIRSDVALDAPIAHPDRARREHVIDRDPHDRRRRGEAGLEAEASAAVA